MDFWASWCETCQVFAPVFEEASKRHPDVAFITVDAQEHPQLAYDFSVQSVPTVLVFRDQVLLFAEPGWLPGATLEALIHVISTLDMEHVRSEIAQAASSAPGEPEGETRERARLPS